VIMLVIFDV